MNTKPALVIAAPTSGSGKTTVALGLIRALLSRGLTVQPFKAGPDYIDSSYLGHAADRPSRNLDTWMVAPVTLVELYERAMRSSDIAIIEGVMGLFDGRGGSEEGSTAHLAKLLKSPVIVVVDIGKVSRSAGAIALGCQQFDPGVNIRGFILNRVASENHRRWATESITSATNLPVVGWLPKRDDIMLPERHLGLIPTTEGKTNEAFFNLVSEQVQKSFNIDMLIQIAQSNPPNRAGNVYPQSDKIGIYDRQYDEKTPNRPSQIQADVFPPKPCRPVATIAIAQDEAFSFYYSDNLDLLSEWGAHLVPFSPIKDAHLPEGTDAIYIGGGFPELFARELASNSTLIEEIRVAAKLGMPIYGECGGLMYLSQGIVDLDMNRHLMVGLVPAWSTMNGRRLTLGYRQLAARRNTPLLQKGQSARGHEFHWSVLETPLPSESALYDVIGADGISEGYSERNIVASYCHLHFGSNPVLAPNFVASAISWKSPSRSPLTEPLLGGS